MTKETIWVVAADSRSARIFEGGRTGPLTEIETLVNPEAGLAERELTTDAPGRATARGSRRQTFEPRTTKRVVARERLAAAVATRARAGRDAQRFVRLYIVAAPSMLGELRDEIAKTGVGITDDLPAAVIQDSADAVRARLPRML